MIEPWIVEYLKGLFFYGFASLGLFASFQVYRKEYKSAAVIAAVALLFLYAFIKSRQGI